MLALVAWAAGSVLACREPSAGTRDISRDEFIETYTALLKAEAAAEDSADARSRKAWVLERRGITQADLERFAMKHADDPDYMAELWREIEAEIRKAQAPDTAESAEGKNR